MTHSPEEHYPFPQKSNLSPHVLPESAPVFLYAKESSSKGNAPIFSREPVSQNHRKKNAGQLFLEPVRVVRQQDAPFTIPLYVAAFIKGHALHCRFRTEDQHHHEWDFSPDSLPVWDDAEKHPGFTCYRLTLPEVAIGYHDLVVEDTHTGEHAEMRLIVAPDACYQPTLAQNKEARLWGLSLKLPRIASHKNWGVGDLGDLIRIIDWCANEGADFIHLNDGEQPLTSQLVLLDVEAIEDFGETDEARKLVFSPEFQEIIQSYREDPMLDTQRVEELKLKVLRLLFRNFSRNHLKKNSFRAHGFRTFIQKQGKRLEHFALYQALQEYFKHEDPFIRDWRDWPEAYHQPDSPAAIEFAVTNPERIGFYQYLQWQLDIQLHAAGLRSWEQNLGIGLCPDFELDEQRVPMMAWSHRQAEQPQREKPQGKKTVPHPVKYQGWIKGLRHTMQHAGAIHIRSLASLFDTHESITQTAIEANRVLHDFLGILALESHRQHCLVLASVEDSSLRAALRKYGLFPTQSLIFGQNETEADDLSGKEPSGLQPKAWEPATLLQLRKEKDPCFSDFWGATDILRRYESGAASEPLKTRRDVEIKQRALLRIDLLQQLDKHQLLPEGITPDPISAPQVTPELSAAVHQLVADTPARLFAAHLDDMLVLENTELREHLQKYPLPVEQWGREAGLLTISKAIRKIRPRSDNQATSSVLPGLESEHRASLLTPRAIYRLQFNRNFTFRDAANLVPYLNRLGISHCYASPLLKAREESPHGYDITDHQQLNQDIGTFDDFRYFADKLRMHGMGLIVDIVPNHMGAGKDNPWWLDVLENGLASNYAEYFDIDWHPLSEDLQEKILLAILGDAYGKILENGEIQLRFDNETGRFWLHYWEHQVPIDPASYPTILGYRLDILETRLGHNEGALFEYKSLLSAFENLQTLQKTDRERERTITLNRLLSLYRQTPEIQQFIEENVQSFQSRKEQPTSLNRLNRLLKQQHYRLANWRVASDEINYRRFFDINDLIAVRVEDERVFMDTHELIMKLVEQGLIQGLRIDHPDGLYAPARYFHRLQTEVARRLGLPEQKSWHLGSPDLPFYILIEKIMAPFERLPRDWAVHGTTGYEFANAVNGLFICQENEKEFTRIYEKFIGQKVDFDTLCYESKKFIMKTALNSELGVLTHQLHQLSKAHWCYQDFTLHNLRSALIEVVACFPVYRTYVTEHGVSRKDQEYIEWAIRSAKRKNLSTDESVFDFMHAVLLTNIATTQDAEDLRNAAVHFAMKFQQYSSPVMAKGVEDTAFYRYNRLVSLNEVGGNPKQFGCSVSHFHYQNIERMRNVPHTLLATSTHDTKRSEDVRARLSVLSEMPGLWSEHVQYWRRINKPFKKLLEDGITAPSANDEYLFYQTLIGIWPFHEPGDGELESLTVRIEAYMLKAVREAKEHSGWINPSEAYEAALSSFVRNVLLRPSRIFLQDFSAFHKTIARLGALNSISQVLLKLTSPGVPDLYQGNELLTFTLVDPDNRQPVDYALRMQSLRQIDDMLDLHDMDSFHQQLESLCNDLSDSRLKQYIISTTLHFRSAQPPLFREGEYIPLEVTGQRAEHIVAFARCWHGLSLITVTPRLFYTLGSRKKERPCGRRIWRDTAVILPEHMAGQSFRNLFDRMTISPTGSPAQELPVADILRHLPVGLLVAS